MQAIKSVFKNRGKREPLTRLEKRQLPMVYLFLLPTIIIFLMFYISPILTVFYTGFTSWNGFNPPEWTGLRNYIRLFTRDTFKISMKNLLAWSAISMTLHVAIGTLVGFLMYHQFKGWKFVRAVYMIPNVISGAAWAMIYKFVFNDEYGLLNNMIRKINPNFHVTWFYSSPAAFWAITFTWLFYAVIVSLIVLGDLMAIPQELHEAAYIDGATTAQVTRYIDLPLSRIGIATGVICSGTARISMYEAIALTTRGGPGKDTMSLSIQLVNSITDYNYGMANAVGTVMFIIGIVMLVLIRSVFRMNESVY